MIIINSKAGRPKGKKAKEEKTERSVYNPKTEKDKQIYVETELRARRRRALMKPEATRKRENELKLLLQRRYYHQFEVVGINKFGLILEHPKLKLLGRIFKMDSGSGESIREYYFPELYTEKKRERQIKRAKRIVIKSGLTAHDLRMQGMKEEEITLIFE